MFPLGSVRVCVEVMILDDDLEEPLEMFTAQIDGFLPSNLQLAIGAISNATITIVDDDSKFLYYNIIYKQLKRDDPEKLAASLVCNDLRICGSEVISSL